MRTTAAGGLPEVHWAEDVTLTIVGEIVYCTIKSEGRTIIYEASIRTAERAAASWAAAVARFLVRKSADILRFPGKRQPPAH